MPALPRERLAMASASDAAALGRTCIPAGTADTATNAAAVTNPSKIYCDPCKKWLPSYEIWRKHIHSSRNHFACPICDIDHRTLEARKRHLDQNHSAEQNLTCPGCKRTFNRLGGLMSHMEFQECVVLKPGFVEELRINNPRSSGVFDNIRANTEALSWSIGTFGLQSLPRNTSAAPEFVSTAPPRLSGAARAAPPIDPFLTNFVREQAAAVGDDDDLINFEEQAPSWVINAPWEQTVIAFTKSDFPDLVEGLNKITTGTAQKQASLPASGLAGANHAVKAECQVVNLAPYLRGRQTGPALTSGSSTAPFIGRSTSATTSPFGYTVVPRRPTAIAVSSEALASPAWDTTSTKKPASTALSPNVPPAVAPPVASLHSLSINAAPAVSVELVYPEHDPSNPNFKVDRYFNVLTRNYKCPHPKCMRNLASVTAFIQHLRSSIHQPDLQKVKCPHCLRPFGSATSLTQHIESQGVRCRARMLDQIDTLVEDITQVATVAGHHEDDTVRYVNLPGQLSGVQAHGAVLGAASRVVQATLRTVDDKVKTTEKVKKKLQENTKW